MSEEQSAKERFSQMYAAPVPPTWDIGRPQPAFIEIADKVTGRVLDVGCGTGEYALYLASRGHEVVGIDIVEPALETAKKKSAERGVDVEFREMNVLELADWDERFDSVIDCGLFHVFPEEKRPTAAENIAAVLKPGGRLFLMCFSDKEPGTEGPHRISEQEIRRCFADGWTIESITPTRFEARPDTQMEFSPGGPHSWMCIIRRSDSKGSV